MPFTFVVNVYVPHASQLSIVCYFRARDEAELRRMEQPEVALFWAFVHGDDAFRNERFKLIPKIPTGSLLIRQAVGQKPALIGRKLTMPYTSRDHYFEVGVDVCSSTVADYTTRLVRDENGEPRCQCNSEISCTHTYIDALHISAFHSSIN